MKASATAGPPEVLTALGVFFRLHEHPDVIAPVEVCAALGVPSPVPTVFDVAIGGLGLVHCGSGRPDRSIEIEAADLMAAVPAAVIAPIADSPGDEPG